jgi:GAF domain-containing protein
VTVHSDPRPAPAIDVAVGDTTTLPVTPGLLHELLVAAGCETLREMLDRIVNLLTDATGSAGCFVYLRTGDYLRVEAASRAYRHVVGHIEFEVSEGLTGWVLRRNHPALIREDATANPRAREVPELDDYFHSLVAAPIPSRDGEGIGVIALHTLRPRQLSEDALDLLTHVAALVAGPIENARIHEAATVRNEKLTRLTALGQEIAAASERETLYSLAVNGIALLVGCSEARLYQLDTEAHRLEAVASVGPFGEAVATQHEPTLLPIEMLQHERGSAVSPAALGLGPGLARVIIAPVVCGSERLGLVLAGGDEAMASDAEELLGMIANQLAAGLKTAQLIERLTDENIVRDLFEALDDGRLEDAESRARQARCELDRPSVVLDVRPGAPDAEGSWLPRVEKVEARLRHLEPGIVCDHRALRLRVRLPVSGHDERQLTGLDERLRAVAQEHTVVIGRSEIHRGAAAARDALREAEDAAVVGASLRLGSGVVPYSELGVYRYLVHIPPLSLVSDPYLAGLRRLEEYDRRRGTELLSTLDRYLARKGNVTHAAADLIVHPNTLRQRLERIETLAAFALADADVLALGVAVKFARLTPTVP